MNQNYGRNQSFGSNNRYPNKTTPETKIVVQFILLISSTGQNLGKKTLTEAKRLAQLQSMDLVLLTQGQTPVYKILDQKKLKYQQKKKQKQASKVSNHYQTIKQIRIGQFIGKHDLQVKNNKARQLLQDGYRVKYTVEQKARGEQHSQVAKRILSENLSLFTDVAVYSQPKSMGKFVSSVMSPTRKAKN